MSSAAKITIHPLNESNDQKLHEESGQLSLDIFTHENQIIIQAPVAGIKSEDIHLSITDEVLVIRGKRQAKYQIPEKDYYTHECFWGSFNRSIVLPTEADIENISANFEDNVLEIRIPKKEINRTRIIKINQ